MSRRCDSGVSLEDCRRVVFTVKSLVKMNSFFLLVILSAFTSVAFAATCTECKTTYDTSYAAATDVAGKCTATQTYDSCLMTSSDRDTCDTMATKLDEAKTAYTSTDTGPCAPLPDISADTCACRKTFLSSPATTELEKCKRAVILEACVNTATAADCDGSTTNADVMTSLKDYYKTACSGTMIQVSYVVTILLLLASYFLKK